MSNQQNDELLEKVSELEMFDRNYDNLFSANHRRMMINKYGLTSAEFITIGELI